MVSVVFGRRSEDAGPRVATLNVVAITVLLVVLAPGVVAFVLTRNPFPLIAAAVVGLVLMQSPRIAQQWERAVVLKLGRFVGLRGPGLFWIVPFVDRVSSWIDQRTITTTFAAEQTLTSDTVPVNVDAVLVWMVHDAMSRQAQAEREKQARIILGQAETEIAHSFEEAAKSYAHNPTALHLRAMNMLYEGLKEKGALMLIPSSAVESMGMGGLMGAAALRQSSLTGGGDPGAEERPKSA